MKNLRASARGGKKTAQKGWAVAVVIFMIFMMILWAAGGVLSAFSNQSSQPQAVTQETNPPTEVIPFTPLISGLEAIQKGTCRTNSIAAPYRADAWRCMVGNSISDPCFEISNSKNLFCNIDPTNSASTSSFVLQLDKLLPKSEVPTSTPSNWAWAILLNDGTYCTPFTGTRPFSSTGEAAYYSCSSKNPSEELIFGDLNNSSTVWTASIGTFSKATSTFPPAIESLQNLPIKTVWQ